MFARDLRSAQDDSRCFSPISWYMKIASWNINSLRKREERLIAWLAAFKPDVVCLQETKCTDDQFPALALESAGYYAAFHGQKSYNGVAIISKTPLADVQTSMCDDVDDPHARVIVATVGNVRIFSIYAPNGQAVESPAYQYKLEWYRRLQDCVTLSDPAKTKVVVCGDFNVAPADADTHDADLWRGAIMCSERERKAFHALCGTGFRDTLRLHHPEAGLFSWWDYRMLSFPKNRGLRIDAVLATKELATHCVNAGIDREMRKGKDPSDHAPIWAEFEL